MERGLNNDNSFAVVAAVVVVDTVLVLVKKGAYGSSSELRLRATGRHLPYGITVLPATRHK